MLKIRPYKSTDADTVLSWCKDEKQFYQWTAGKIGTYPATRYEFSFVEKLISFIAFDEVGDVGFFTLRNQNKSSDELRLGFIILNPDKRGKGYGKEMVQLGLKLAFESYNVKRVTIGVFENNPAAYHCYKAVGFAEAGEEKNEVFHILGEDWKYIELIKER